MTDGNEFKSHVYCDKIISEKDAALSALTARLEEAERELAELRHFKETRTQHSTLKSRADLAESRLSESERENEAWFRAAVDALVAFGHSESDLDEMDTAAFLEAMREEAKHAESRIAELEAALGPFAQAGRIMDAGVPLDVSEGRVVPIEFRPDVGMTMGVRTITVGDFRLAARALSKGVPRE